MVNKLITAVSIALYNEFGGKDRIYPDNIEQHLERPCFFINVVRPSKSERLMGRAYRSVPLVIQYFPKSQGKRTECYGVAERLFQCLSYPQNGDDMFRGTDMRYDINDDKLNFHVQYNFYTLTVNDDEKILMADVSESIDSKREDDE